MCKWNTSCINIWKGCYGESSDLPAGEASVNFNKRANYRADLIWWKDSIDLSGHWVRSPISLRSYCRHFFRLWSCLILGISKGISNTIFVMLTSQRMNRKDNSGISHPKLLHCCWNERGLIENMHTSANLLWVRYFRQTASKTFALGWEKSWMWWTIQHIIAIKRRKMKIVVQLEAGLPEHLASVHHLGLWAFWGQLG